MQNQLRELIGLASQLLQTLNRPFYSKVEFWAIIMALVIAILSPYIVEKVKRWVQRSKLKPIIVQSWDQPLQMASDYKIFRLLLENNGATAYDVEANIYSILENGEKKRDNFLPCPLTWTHGQVYRANCLASRDIHKAQEVYLDVLEFYSKQAIAITNSTSNKILQLTLQAGKQCKSFSRLNPGLTKLQLKIYQRSGQTV